LDKLGHMKDSGNVPVKKPEMNVPREWQRITLKWILKKWGVRYGLGSNGSGYRRVTGSCLHVNESSGSIKDAKFLDQLSDYECLKKTILHQAGSVFRRCYWISCLDRTLVRHGLQQLHSSRFRNERTVGLVCLSTFH
jgi:hypothetical protein